MGQVWLHFGSSLCRRGSGGGRSGDPNHDVSTAFAVVKKSSETGFYFQRGRGSSQGALYWSIPVSEPVFPHL